MAFSVRQALEIYPLSKGRVIAGSNGLDNEISSVDVLEVPDSAQYIAPGQLEISALYSILDSEEEQIRVIRMLKMCHASGLVLSHVGVIMKSVSSKLIKACDELSFPLIQVPHNIAYTDILSPLIDRLLNVQNQRLAAAMQIYDQMTALILDECDFDRILNTVSELIHRHVRYYNHNDTCVAQSGSPLDTNEAERLTTAIQAEKPKLFNCEEVRFTTDDGSGSRTYLFVPVSSTTSYYGVMVIADPEGLTPLEHIAVMQTKNALGIMTLNKINLKDCNQLLLNDYISDLLSRNFANEESAIQRGYALGCDVTSIRTVLVIDIYSFNVLSAQHTEAELGLLKKQLRQFVADELARASPQSIFMQQSDKVIILYACQAPDANLPALLTRLGNYFISRIKAVLGIDVSVGIGSTCRGISDIPGSYQDAQNTIYISNRLFQHPRCASHMELPVFSMLAWDTIDKCGLRQATKALLNPVVSETDKCGVPLLETFRLLVMNNLNTAKVADDLFIHKNTVLQRKQKITRLYSYDPFEAPYLQQFVMAFIFHDLIS